MRLSIWFKKHDKTQKQLDPVLIEVLLWSANAGEEDIAKVLFIRDKR